LPDRHFSYSPAEEPQAAGMSATWGSTKPETVGNLNSEKFVLF
jgi:hypothetical protein